MPSATPARLLACSGLDRLHCVHRIGHVPELPDELWETVLTNRSAGLYGAKALRKIARVCCQFAAVTRAHPDNITLLGSHAHPIVVD